MKEGWICIHRKIWENTAIWETDEPFDMRSAWIDLLLMVNHQDKRIIFDYKPLLVKRGQCITSVRSLAARWHWSKNKVLKYLRLLELLQMIKRDSNNQRTLLTIENYGFYQDMKDTDGTQTGHRRDASMPQTTMNNNVKQKKNVFRNFPEREIDYKALEEEVT